MKVPRVLTIPTPRRGKWTPEEERLSDRLIHYFNSGLLDIPKGTMLRSFLAKKLNCEPMRISKKYMRDAAIGKRSFVPVLSEDALAAANREIHVLEQAWYEKLLETQTDRGVDIWGIDSREEEPRLILSESEMKIRNVLQPFVLSEKELNEFILWSREQTALGTSPVCKKESDINSTTEESKAQDLKYGMFNAIISQGEEASGRDSPRTTATSDRMDCEFSKTAIHMLAQSESELDELILWLQSVPKTRSYEDLSTCANNGPPKKMRLNESKEDLYTAAECLSKLESSALYESKCRPLHVVDSIDILCAL